RLMGCASVSRVVSPPFSFASSRDAAFSSRAAALTSCLRQPLHSKRKMSSCPSSVSSLSYTSLSFRCVPKIGRVSLTHLRFLFKKGDYVGGPGAGRYNMKRLTTAQAVACERAQKPTCKCRCRGIYHGRSHAILLRQESEHEAELLEVSRQDFVHLLQVWGVPDVLQVPQPVVDV